MDNRARSRSRGRTESTDPTQTCSERWVHAFRALAEFEEGAWAGKAEAEATSLGQIKARRLQLLREAGEALGYPPESWLYSADAADAHERLEHVPATLNVEGHLEPGRPGRTFSPRAAQGRSSFEQNRQYTLENHIEMVLDVHRVAAFQTCIHRAAPGRRVLDVGSGAFCLLGRLALKAGAVLVHCVEQSSASMAHARELFQMEMARTESPPLLWLRRTPATLCPDQMQLMFPSPEVRRWEIHVEDAAAAERVVHEVEQHEEETSDSHSSRGSYCGTVLLWPDDEEFPTSLELHQGLCAEVPLPGEYDLVLHEVLGYMASSEGVVPTIRDLHARQLPTRGCQFIPSAAGTYFAPTARIEMTDLEMALHQLFNGEEELAVKTKYNVRHFDPSSFLSKPEVFEWFQFDTPATLVDQERLVEFRTAREGYFDGLHFHLLIELDPLTTLNVLTVPTTWCTSYIRLLREAVFLPAGSLITCQCRAASGPTAQYFVELWLGPATESPPLARFAWSGCS